MADNQLLTMDSIIIEIRAGAGGDEASLFAADLYKMYTKYAASRGWLVKTLDLSNIGIGGIKQVVFEIKGEGVLSELRNEAGVHRVQRVPQTEKNNRIHTSTASVAVLEKPKEAQISINPSEISMDFFKSSGPGGQNVNKRQTAVRITHLPTGVVVASQAQRTLEDNRRTAMAILEAKLLEQKNKALSGELTQERRNQIGTADRSEKIRTYNFPQDRITDHRINKSWYNIEKILDGKMEKMLRQINEGLKN